MNANYYHVTEKSIEHVVDSPCFSSYNQEFKQEVINIHVVINTNSKLLYCVTNCLRTETQRKNIRGEI